MDNPNSFPRYRLGFLLLPVGIVLVIGGFFLCRGLAILFTIRTGHTGLLNENALSKITWTMIRIGKSRTQGFKVQVTYRFGQFYQSCKVQWFPLYCISPQFTVSNSYLRSTIFVLKPSLLCMHLFVMLS